MFPQFLPQNNTSSQWSWFLLVGLLLCIPLAFGMSSLHVKTTKQRVENVAASESLKTTERAQESRLTSEDSKPITVALRTTPGAAKTRAAAWRNIKVKSGDNLTLIFERLGLDQKQLLQILSNGGPAKSLQKLHPGDVLKVFIKPRGTLQELTHRLDATTSLRVKRSGDGFGVTTVHTVPDKRIAQATGKIDQSLFLSARKAGLSHHMTMELAKLFGWDIDFALDIRRGDQFTLIYERLYVDGDFIGEGDIIAAEFINRGRTYQAVRYVAPGQKSNYFTPDGRSLRKAFLRSPVAFSRISSRFSNKRKHPVLNTIRAHKGVDYAAPRGTPIRAAGDGKIVHRSTKGGYGKTVVLNHGRGYRTLYAHLSNYRRGKRVGTRVQQGDIIGYVGSTGMATGSHLHYEFLVNGVHRNPLTVRLPSAKPIAKRHKADFERKTETLIAQLQLVKKTRLAQSAKY